MVPAFGENPYELVEIFRKSVAILNSPSADSTWMDEVADLSQTLKNIYFKQNEAFLSGISNAINLVLISFAE